MRSLFMAISLLVPVAAFTVTALSAQTGLSAQSVVRQITVSGQGYVETAPDRATLSLGVVSDGKTGAAALAANNKAMAKVMAKLAAAGISPEDLQTQNLSLSPRWNTSSVRDRNESEINGFTVRNMLSVEILDLSNLGTVLDAAVSTGANSFNGISFGLSDPSHVIEKARRGAVADAIAKAELYANAAGVSLGSLVSINEQGSPSRPVPMAAMRMADSVPVATGEVTVSATVTLVFEIAD